MADAIGGSITTKRWFYELRSPTNAVELDKAVQWASADYKKATGDYPKFDDTIKIESSDETIRVYWDQVISNGD